MLDCSGVVHGDVGVNGVEPFVCFAIFLSKFGALLLKLNDDALLFVLDAVCHSMALAQEFVEADISSELGK